MTTLKQYILAGVGLSAVIGIMAYFTKTQLQIEPSSIEALVTTTQASENTSKCFTALRHIAADYESLVNFCTSEYVITEGRDKSFIYDYTQMLIHQNN